MRGSPSEERARAAEKGGGGDVDPSVRRLIPSNSPLGDAADALAAIKKGDFLGALKGAAKLAGNVTPFGGVVSNVLGMFGLARSAHGRGGQSRLNQGHFATSAFLGTRLQ